MSSIPDSLSTADLQAMLADAPKEHDQDCPGCPECDGEYSEANQESAVEQGLTLMIEQCDDPAVHKMAVLKVCNNMVHWHTKVGEAAMERGDTDCGTAWLRDAGKWQAVMDIVMSIGLGPNDHMVCQ